MMYVQVGRLVVRTFDGVRAYQDAAHFAFLLGIFGILPARVHLYKPSKNAVRF